MFKPLVLAFCLITFFLNPTLQDAHAAAPVSLTRDNFFNGSGTLDSSIGGAKIGASTIPGMAIVATMNQCCYGTHAQISLNVRDLQKKGYNALSHYLGLTDDSAPGTVVNFTVKRDAKIYSVIKIAEGDLAQKVFVAFTGFSIITFSMDEVKGSDTDRGYPVLVNPVAFTTNCSDVMPTETFTATTLKSGSTQNITVTAGCGVYVSLVVFSPGGKVIVAKTLQAAQSGRLTYSFRVNSQGLYRVVVATYAGVAQDVFTATP